MSEVVTVRILDRDYSVGCGPGEREGLMEAARTLDARMREVRGDNRMVAVERVAVLTALNLAHELQQSRRETRVDPEVERALERMERRLGGLLQAGEPPRNPLPR